MCEPVGLEETLLPQFPSDCRHSPLLASQILTVSSKNAHTSLVESCKKVTDIAKWLWFSSICRYMLLLAPHIMIVLSPNYDASLVES